MSLRDKIAKLWARVRNKSGQPEGQPPAADKPLLPAEVRSLLDKHRGLIAKLTAVTAILLACSAYVDYSSRIAIAKLVEDIKTEAKAGGAEKAEKGMRTNPQLWMKKEYAVSEYLELLKAGKLTAIGLPDGSSFKTAEPHVLLVTRSGDLGYVSDTWRGNLTERSMADRPEGLKVITVSSTPIKDPDMSALDLVKLFTQFLFLGVLLFSMKDMLPMGGAKFQPVRNIPTRFDDVVGASEAKAALQDLVDFLKTPDAYTRLGARPSRGVLLYGPPGTGKTLLAKALAGECGCSFIACSGADFSSKWYGVGISTVKSLFKQARKETACIIFIDEIDGIGQRVNSGEGAGASESNRIINQLLVEIDGFAEDSRVIIMGATNLLENIDPALQREGRFDRKISLRLPEVDERQKLMELYSKKLALAEDIDFGQLARMTLGLSPAAIASLVNQAAVRAARDNSPSVGMQHMADAIETAHLGEASGTVLTPEERRRTGVHEAGHAIAAILRKSGTVEKVTVLPRGNALGVTFISQEEMVRMQTPTTMNHRIDVFLAGRVAEELVYGEASIGAGGDLQQATGIATEMLARYGFGQGLAVLNREQLKGEFVLNRVNELLAERYAETVKLLEPYLDTLNAVADLLDEEETIQGAVVRDLVAAAPTLQ